MAGFSDARETTTMAEEDRSYARLPADALAEILNNAEQVCAEVETLLLPAMQQREQLRQAALDGGIITTASNARPTTLCAVDGGFAVERTVAVDIVMALAVGVEGFSEDGSGPTWSENQYHPFNQVLLHNVDNERLARTAMMANELAVIADAPHNVRIFDGSHLTAVIQLNSSYSSRSDQVRRLALEVSRECELDTALEAFVTVPQIIGMPKYDSSTELTKRLSRSIGQEIPGDDKFVMSLVLEEGEHTRPVAVAGGAWTQLHLKAFVEAPRREHRYVQRLHEILTPLRQCQLSYMYWKPAGSSSAYRIEMKPELAASDSDISELIATLERQIAAPFVREPYPQYLADVMAKSVGLGLDALQSASHLRLSRTQPDLAPQLIHSYRTEGL
ncbi:hypothetical protein ASE16_02000 [Leifsonia sp. Root227]|nr:hypothetical protein ASE16_02000 [Leifsonia sp. Root227]